MHLLLDTHVLLWWLQSRNRLSANASSIIAGASDVSVSSVSIWELAIKVANGKINIDIDDLVVDIAKNGFRTLAITYAHAAAVARLPPIHRDPFDRMLVAQAMCEPMKLLTADRVLADYSPLVEVI